MAFGSARLNGNGQKVGGSMLSAKVRGEIEEIVAASERTIHGDMSQLLTWLKQSVSVGYSRNGYDKVPMWTIVLALVLLTKKS